jgi:hypothetical protein
MHTNTLNAKYALPNPGKSVHKVFVQLRSLSRSSTCLNLRCTTKCTSSTLGPSDAQRNQLSVPECGSCKCRLGGRGSEQAFQTSHFPVHIHSVHNTQAKDVTAKVGEGRRTGPPAHPATRSEVQDITSIVEAYCKQTRKQMRL